MKHTRHLLRPIRETVFGKYDVLRPPKTKTTASNKSLNFISPSPVSLSVIRPDYVPVNFWTRRSEREALEYDESSRLEEGWPGEEGVGSLESGRGMIPLGGIDEQTVRYAARLASEVLRDAGRLIKASRRDCAHLTMASLTLFDPVLQPGLKTKDLDRTIHEMIVARDAYPSPLGYKGFTKSVTTSINNVICRKSLHLTAPRAPSTCVDHECDS
jgi:hypothetical protein